MELDANAWIHKKASFLASLLLLSLICRTQNGDGLLDWKIFAVRCDASPKPHTTEHSELTHNRFWRFQKCSQVTTCFHPEQLLITENPRWFPNLSFFGGGLPLAFLGQPFPFFLAKLNALQQSLHGTSNSWLISCFWHLWINSAWLHRW